MEWAKTRPHAPFDLAGSNVLACSIDDLPGARAALAFEGDNDAGYAPLMEGIAATYAVQPSQITTASGTAGANFFALAALLEPGDEVLVERPGYDPLIGAARLFGATTTRFDRVFEEGFTLNPDRVRSAMTPRTKVIIITNPHNPTGVAADPGALDEIGRLAEHSGTHVIVDEVYRDLTGDRSSPAAARGDLFVTTSSLTKLYGLSSLRAGWAIASPELTYRVRRARDVVDGSGSIVAERLAALAFAQLPGLRERTRRLLGANRTVMDAWLRAQPRLEYAPSAGTVVFPRLTGVGDAGSLVDRWRTEDGVAVVPGRFFDAPAHFRLGFGGATDRLRASLEALDRAIAATAG